MTDKDFGSADRILQNVQMDPNGGCWLWAGSYYSDQGYGRLSIAGKTVKAHRASYAVFTGPIGGQWVLHKCDVKECVNPDHLYLGDHAANMADRTRRGRCSRQGGAKGQANLASKLTDADVMALRTSAESSYRAAARLNVTPSMIRRIRRGQAWRHVQSEEVNQNNQVIP
jgi:hypothetical protein